MKKLISLIVLNWMWQCSIYAALPLTGPGYIAPPSVNSPQAEAMIRYDNLPVNMYTGRISMNIPLVELKDKNFNFPISLSYDSGGFKPSESDNFIGRNWSLISGGLIYREINGIPDDLEFKKIGATTSDGARGFLTVYKSYKNKINSKDLKANLYTNPYLYANRKAITTNLSTIPNLGDSQIESSADIYYFSFGNYSGKFMLNFDGNISSITTSGGECRVDLSEYNLVSNTTPYASRIKIKTDDGYIYIFGGDGYGALEYTPLVWKDWLELYGDYNTLQGFTITAYYLTQIIAPNGRKLTIHYKDINSKYHKNPYELSSSYYVPDKQVYMQYNYSARPYSLRSRLNQQADEMAGPPEIQRCLTKIALIDRIITDNVCIRFYYSEREQIPRYSDYNGRRVFADYCGAKLDSIAVCSSENTESNRYEVTRLNYEYHSGDRMFLSSISSSKRGEHLFNYNKVTSSNISPLTPNIDHWGFWRGANSNGQILPTVKKGTIFEEEYIALTTDREPTGEDCDATLLNEVVFPTGGSCRFEYEPNTYSERLETHAPNFIPTFCYPASGQKALAGGARIKTIKYYDQKKTVKQTSYEYNYNLSAGLLNFMPVYKYINWFYFPDSQKTEALGVVYNSDGVNYHPIGAEIVSYQFVKEKYIDYSQPEAESKVSSKVTTFTSLSSNPDVYSTKWGIDPNAFGAFRIWPQSPKSYFGPNQYVHTYNANLGMKPILNASYERGKIKSENYYSSDDRLIKTIKYEYTRIPKDTVVNFYSLPIHPGTVTGTYMHIGTEYFNKYLPVKKSVTEYGTDGNSGGCTTNEEYTYDKNGYITLEKNIRETADTLVTTYSYNSLSYQLPPDKAVYAAKNNGRNLIYSEKYTSYFMSSDWYQVQSISVGNEKKTDTIIEYRKYDKYGNPVHIVTNGLYSTIYIWGYYGQYLIAKIENATYTEVTIALDKIPESFSESIVPFMFPINLLRQKLPEAQVYTYTYQPYVGILTSTDPTGYMLKYRYDKAGRLTEIWKVSDKEVSTLMQVNKYNLVNQ